MSPNGRFVFVTDSLTARVSVTQELEQARNPDVGVSFG